MDGGPTMGDHENTPAGTLSVDRVPAGIWSIDTDGVTVHVNDSMAAMLGRTVADMLGTSVVQHCHPDDRAEVLAHVSIRRSGVSDMWQARLLHHDGTFRHVRAFGTPVQRDGQYAGSTAVIVDVTDLVHRAVDAESGRRDADAARLANTRFLSWVSHELRTPLNSITGFAQLLEQLLDDPATRQMATNVLTAAAHVNGLVQDLLDHTRAEADMLAPSLADVALLEVANEVVMLASGAAREHDVTVVLDGDDATAVADRRHLVQALLNLVSNAIKYGGTGSEVRITIGSAQGRARVAVSDQGPGIPPTLQQRVFRPFERLAPDSPVDGVGLGLSIADAFVRAMHGSLSLSSPPGRGATFTIDLPAAATDPAAHHDHLGTDSTMNQLVLYVEDEPLNAALVENIIGFLPGRTLHVEPTVAGGIEAVQRLRPALVLLDLNLPDGSGLDVLRVIRDDETLRATPVFILSADATEQSSSRALELGADRFITKPFNLKEFMSLVESHT